MQVVDLLQNSMPLRYDDLSASQAFLKATMAVNDLTADLHKHHGAVRDFMREILSSVSPIRHTLHKREVLSISE